MSRPHSGISYTLYAIVASVLLASIKLTFGILGSSSALISDGVNSLSDIVGYSVVAVSLLISGKKADRGHQYGHEKIESVVSLLFSLVIIFTGAGIGYSGILLVLSSDTVPVPTALALWAAVVSLGAKLFMALWTGKGYRDTHSSALKALYTDHLSDAVATGGALLGVLGAQSGFPVFDPLASILIALFVIYSGSKVLRSSFQVLMDASADAQTVQRIRTLVGENHDVLQIDLLKTRTVGSGYYVDIEICLEKDLSLEQAHEIAEAVHDRIEEGLPSVRHVMVHTNPCKRE